MANCSQSGATPSRLEPDPDAPSGQLEYDRLKADMVSSSSSVFDYEYENGRRYHAYQAGKYLLPNDDQEQARLDFVHHCFRLVLDGNLCLSKLDKPGKILDVGTGTGIWAIQIGEQCPKSEVIGTDLSPIQPSWLPPNVQFLIDDVSQEWIFPDNEFDFIHVRCLAGSIADWERLVSECYRHLAPGGRLEISEVRSHVKCDDDTYPDDCHTKRWIDQFHQLSRQNGLDFDPFPTYRGFVEKAGFHNVAVEERVCPIGSWTKDNKLKELGKYFRFQFIEGAVDAYSLAVFTRFGGWKENEVRILLAHVRNELKSNNLHIYTQCSFLTAQKPSG